MDNNEFNVDFHEGYCVGMSAAIKMVRNTVMSDEEAFAGLLSEGIIGLLNVADKKIDEFRSQPTNF